MTTEPAVVDDGPFGFLKGDQDAILRAFVELASVATFMVTTEGKLTYANRACGELLGYEPSELLGLDFRTLVHRDDLLVATTQAAELVSGTITSYRVQRRYIRKDGEPVWVICSVSLLRSAYAPESFFSVQAIDINAQKLAEAALAESERRWEFALDSAGQGVWEADIENNTVHYSPTWKRIRGYAPHDDIDSSAGNWLARVHPDDRDRIRDIIEKQNSGEIKRNAFEYRERHKDGHYIWILSLGAPDIWDADGRPKRVIGTDTDITQLKLAEQTTKRLAHRLELALKVSKIGVFEGNLRTGELIWDDRVREIFGVPPDREDLRAEDWEKSIHPEDLPIALGALNAAVAEKGTFSQRFRIVRPSGEIRFVTSQATYFEEADGTPKFVGANEDVTEEVALAEGLKSANILAEARNIELEAAKARIETQSLHDALTGLPNRRYLDEVLNQHVSNAAGISKAGLALLHIDLDRFKQINDTLGHVAGDAMLKHVARLLLDAAGIGNFVARVGGDEFIVVCLNETDVGRLANLADLIISKIQRPVPYEGHFCRFGASIGIAIETGGAIDTRRVLINGDMALYRAKGRGRNRYEFFSKALQHEAESTKRIADDILRGLEQQEFVPYYQPVVDAKTFEVVGAEALVRWNHPIEGLLPPSRFLKIAEELDVLAAIDRTILEVAITDFGRWKKLGLPISSISVNVSLRRLNDEGLIPSLRALAIEPGSISFEFLESIFLDEFDDRVAFNIDALRAMGIGIDVDDFGTGHTSFVSLLKLNPRRFKIDRQLISPISENSEQRRLVASIVEIGRTLGIKVVAEGVETMAQATILRDVGCDYLQGYAFARPMPADDLTNWLKSPVNLPV
jgi:diguanylate cyclase (GGDEF)-like protein/PAS domain S-box-containing protein